MIKCDENFKFCSKSHFEVSFDVVVYKQVGGRLAHFTNNVYNRGLLVSKQLPLNESVRLKLTSCLIG